MNNIPYLLALHLINGLGPIRLKAILDYFKDPKLAWEADLKEIKQIGIPENVVNLLSEKRKKLDPLEYAQSIEKSGIKWLTIFDESYPKLLSQIYDPPTLFYYKGQINWNDPSVAVVGTRKITGYGKIVTEKFTKALIDANLVIVSGLARGVDSIAHKTAVLSNGQTIAVLGGGLNKIFPSENERLAEEIIDGHGVILSEFPPEYPSSPGNFPARNRIISGLSLATLVTEAASDSGSLITARQAIEQGREVFAVPGPITSYLSAGPIDLIKQGARAVSDPGEILEEIGLGQIQNSKIKFQNLDKLSEDEKRVLQCLENESKHLDEIGRAMNMSAAQISSTLLKMEIAGFVQNLGSGIYTKL